MHGDHSRTIPAWARCLQQTPWNQTRLSLLSGTLNLCCMDACLFALFVILQCACGCLTFIHTVDIAASVDLTAAACDILWHPDCNLWTVTCATVLLNTAPVNLGISAAASPVLLASTPVGFAISATAATAAATRSAKATFTHVKTKEIFLPINVMMLKTQRLP